MRNELFSLTHLKTKRQTKESEGNKRQTKESEGK